MTIVLSTHDLRLARRCARGSSCCRAAAILAEGPPAEVLTPALIGQLFDVDAGRARRPLL